MERSQAPLGQKAEHGIWLAEEMCSSTWRHTQSCKGKVTLMGVDMSMDVGMGMDMAMGIDTGMERHWHVGRSRADTLVCLPTHVGSWRSCWGRSCWRVPVCDAHMEPPSQLQGLAWRSGSWGAFEHTLQGAALLIVTPISNPASKPAPFIYILTYDSFN